MNRNRGHYNPNHIDEEAVEDLRGYYGMDPELSLQSVNFSPGENKYFNEYDEDEEMEEE